MVKAKYIKDHVTGYGKDLSRATRNKFDISNQLIVKAALGDEKSLTQIADMGKLGERLILVMPTIKQHLNSYIQGNTQYNQALAEIYREGGKGALAIDKASSDLTLENTKFNNLIEEYKVRLFASLEAEEDRHNSQMDAIELQAWVDTQMKEIDYKVQMENISNKPFVAQLKADEDYETKKIQHILEHGSESDLSLIPRKQYITNPLRKLWEDIRDLFN
ncbi:hypothetical protein HCG51_34135 (plasmid) [Tolypothrix sp. PCC 7910]|uniref:hypothetical protein n=1 Tax=Tolypothrix sp. PCC 7910 TaxID=2099387 RepID=UPI00142798F3|nr:hypothetical protein [Tolypothrix sp. PCC 7910]QIR41731.1 hypothetical protein HCG51_34135 [Tolypothrix sp. PCC 7910]